MYTFTDEEIREVIVRYVQRYSDLPSPRYQESLVAMKILFTYLPREWYVQNIGGVDKSSTFINLLPLTKPNIARPAIDQHRLVKRFTELGEMLLNFTDVPGFEKRLIKIGTDSVESSVSDLRSAKLLFKSLIPFRFVEETGVAGSDYDIEATIGEHTVACEVKCKLENTEMSEETIANALSKARSQLPDDKPGIVFLKIPEAWTKNPAANTTITPAIASAFKKTGRISAVILQWDQWQTIAPNVSLSANAYRTEHNPKARVSLASLGQIVNPSAGNGRWRSIEKILISSTYAPS